MTQTTKKNIDQFFANKKIAVFGASRNKDKFGNMVLKELLNRGYEAIPVNPSAEEIEGQKCFAQADKLPKDVKAAMLLLPVEKQQEAVQECAAAGLNNLLLYKHQPETVQIARDKGINTVAGYCPFMLLPDSGFPHNMHRFFVKLFGKYPK